MADANGANDTFSYEDAIGAAPPTAPETFSYEDAIGAPAAAANGAETDPNGMAELTVRPASRTQPPAPPPDPNAQQPPPAPQGPAPADATADSDPPSASTPDQSQGASTSFGAALRGAARALPFADDIAAANDTAFSYLPQSVQSYISDNPKDQSGEPLAQRYQENLANQRAIDARDDSENPISSYGGQIAGGLALPVGAAGRLSSAAARYVPGPLAAAVGSSAVGAGYGALYGAGEGDGLQDRAQRAEQGALYGGIAGAVAPAIVEGATNLGKGVLTPLKMATNPAGVAAQRISGALAKDAGAGASGLSPTDISAANANRQPTMLADLGGEATRDLARSAANKSPEARAALQEAVGSRFQSQNTRFSQFMKGVFGNDLDNQAVRDELASKAKAINGPAYRAAYAKGANGIWDNDLAALVQAPDLQAAIGDATRKGANNAVLNGNQIVRSPFTRGEDGTLGLAKGPKGETAFPSLQFWDHVKRALDDKISVARRSGNMEDARDFNSLKQVLVAKLDEAVPEYANAREGAFRTFGAENALEAGEKFLGMSKAADIASVRKAFAQMNPSQREFFAQGLASQIAQKAANAGERSDIVKLFNSPATQEKMRLALGPDRSNQVETYLRREEMMDRLRTALGNSTTARQLIHAGEADGHGASGHGLVGMITGSLSSPMAGAVAGAVGAYHEHGFDPEEITKYAIGGAMAGMLGKFVKTTNQGVVARIGEMLASNDPQVVSRVTREIARNRDMFQAMQRAQMTFSGTAARAGSGQQGEAATPQMLLAPSRAAGGRAA